MQLWLRPRLARCTAMISGLTSCGINEGFHKLSCGSLHHLALQSEHRGQTVLACELLSQAGALGNLPGCCMPGLGARAYERMSNSSETWDAGDCLCLVAKSKSQGAHSCCCRS